MSQLLIASTNPGKLREFQNLLADLPVELLLPISLGITLNVEESGVTYAENAALKARAYAQASQLITLADDSGLEVEALGGAPGLHSARYSPQPGAKDADRRALLLANLTGKPRPWTAHFHCSIAIASPTGEIHFTDGQVWGEIIPQERGNNGFGYDPIFWLSGRGCSMAELSDAEKNCISHRGLAAAAALPILKEWFHC